jgi:hypothetical protein
MIKMILRHRQESDELRLYRYLNARMSLSVKDEQHCVFLEKGFEGEIVFDRMVDRLDAEFIILNDLLLETQGNFFQIDKLLIFGDNISMFEVKNYEGDYYIENDIWYSIIGTEIKNPLDQVKRSDSFLRRYLQNLRSTMKLNSYLVFVNPEFTLYQAPKNKTIILPTQLKRLMREIEKPHGKLNERHMELAKKILAGHVEDSPFRRVPSYQYEELEKGMLCGRCRSIETYLDGGRLVCHSCGSAEDVDSAILRSVEEFMFLFPERKVTTNAIHEWCRAVESKKTVRRVLGGALVKRGNKRHTYFVKSE